MPVGPVEWPRNSIEERPNVHLLALMTKPLSYSRENTAARWCRCLAADGLATRMSSRYTKAKGRLPSSESIRR